MSDVSIDHPDWIKGFKDTFSSQFMGSLMKSCNKYKLLFLHNWWSDQVMILHMPWQLSCHDMCKIMTWLDH